MERWTGAFKEIRRRNFDELCAKIRDKVPYDFENSDEQIRDFLEETWALEKTANAVYSFPGKEAEYIRCFLTAYSKFEHVLDCSRSLFERGSLTWALVDAYHASIIGARAILAALGICIFTIGRRTVVVDMFPEFGTVDQRRKFGKEHKGVDGPVRVMAPSRDQVLDQGNIWNLVRRLVSLKSFASNEEEGLQLAMVDLLDTKPWSDRHEVMYDLSAWRWRGDIGLSPLSSTDLETLLAATDQEVIELSQFVDQIFLLCRFYAEKALGFTIDGKIVLPPRAADASAPTVLS